MSMGLKAMHVSHSTVLIGRRYLEHGFLDVAMRLFVRNAAQVEKRDWSLLVERLMDRHRIVDAVRVCEIGGVPVPCAQLLALGEGSLRRIVRTPCRGPVHRAALSLSVPDPRQGLWSVS